MSKPSNVVEVFQIKPGPSSSSKPKRLHSLPLHPNDSSVPGVKTKLLVRKAGTGGVKGFLNSPMGSKRKKKFAEGVEEEEITGDVSGTSGRGVDNIIMTSTTSSNPISTSSSIPLRKSDSVIKLTTKVTTLDEILKSQSYSQLSELSLGNQTSSKNKSDILFDKSLRNVASAPPLHPSSSSSSRNTSATKNLNTGKITAPTESEGVIVREQDIHEVEEENNTFDNHEDCGGDSSDKENSNRRRCCCRISSCSNCCQPKPKSRYTQRTSLDSGSLNRIYDRRPCGRFTPMLPSQVLTLLGFFSKIYWRVLDGALGLEPPYNYGGDAGTVPQLVCL
jgi:hypothetical protein